MQRKMFSMMALLLMVVNGAWAEKYSVEAFDSEYKSVPTIYAGCQNYFKLDVKNTSEADGSNVVVRIYIDEELIGEKTISSLPAGETANLEFVDPTIRPVDENTVIGNDNKNVVYKVVVSDGVDSDQKEFSFVVLYNGNLGKDYAYPYNQPYMRSESFTGDVLYFISDGYSRNNDTSRDDVFAVNLGSNSVHKALLYVSYNWDKAPEGDFKTWTTTFNGKTIAPLASYRDQTNLGNVNSGAYGYGLVVYDVTEAVVDGDNTFAFEKTAGNVAVFPSSLIVMVKNSSSEPKVVYIAEEADILSSQYNQHTDAIYHSSFKGVVEGDATLYVFAASAQSGEGDIVINDKTYGDVWSGNSQTVNVFEAPVPAGDIAVQFKGTGSTILALQQMLVVKATIDIPGDVNGDGLVNVTDIVATVNYIMEKPSEGFNKEAADLNGDGKINVTDIVMMVSIIMDASAREVTP